MGTGDSRPERTNQVPLRRKTWEPGAPFAVMGVADSRFQRTNQVPLRRKKREPGAAVGKNVVVLKACDVVERDETVFMPNTIEMAQLKKAERGQFKTNVQISSQMTETDIQLILVETFPFLEDQRFYCATSADNRTRLDFHGERRIWNGRLIKQKIKGNSALYIYTDEESVVEQRDFTLTNPPTLKRAHDQLLTMGTAVEVKIPACRFSKRTKLHPTVDKEEEVNRAREIACLNSGTKDNEGTSESDYELQLSDASGQGATDSGNETSANLDVGDVNEMLDVLDACESVIPDRVPCLTASQLQLSDASGQGATDSGNETSANLDVGDVNEMLYLLDACESVIPDRVPCLTASQLQLSDASGQGATDSENETSANLDVGDVNEMLDVLDARESVIPDRVPYLTGGNFCRFDFKQVLPSEIQSGSATFGNLGTVELKRLDNSLIGTRIPARGEPGVETIILKTDAGNVLGKALIDYYDEFEDCVDTVVYNPVLHPQLFLKLAIQAQTNCTNCNAQNPKSLCCTQPLETLKLAVCAAAKLDAMQFIKTVFSSNSGRAIYEACKENSLLPEFIARKHGHVETANYLEEITTRFSKEENNLGEESLEIDWQELITRAQEAVKNQERSIVHGEETYQNEFDSAIEKGYLGDTEKSSGELSPTSSFDSDSDPDYRDSDDSDSDDDSDRGVTESIIKSVGFLSRGRHSLNHSNRVTVHEINGGTLEGEIIRRCRNEGQHPYLNLVDRTTLRFLRAAISFIPVARGDDANMRNCSFIFRQPGREFVVISGDGDWEYEFCEDAVGEIKGRCVRKPIQRYVWDGAKAFVDRSLASGALPATGLYTGGLSGLRAWTH